jgi:cell division protein FtsW
MSRDEMTVTRTLLGRKYFDYTLLIYVLSITAFGLLIIYSASSFNAAKFYNNPKLYFNSQLRFVAIGAVAMLVISRLDYTWIGKRLFAVRGIEFTPLTIFYWFCLALQGGVLLLGSAFGGSSRWFVFTLAGQQIRFQPSEVSKICLILLTAYLVGKNPQVVNTFGGFVKIMLRALPLIVLIAVENFTTALIVACIVLGTCFIVSKNIKLILFIAPLIAGGGFVFIKFVGYRIERIDAWLNVETHAKAYQVRQGFYAIASGNLFGKGLGNGTQKLGYIPEAHTDMLFSIICEELGMFGALALLMVFMLLLWRIYFIARHARELFGSLIATGVFIHISVQLLINVCAVTGLLPTTGVTLPFVSYGGTSLLLLMAEIGLVLSVSNRILYE